MFIGIAVGLCYGFLGKGGGFNILLSILGGIMGGYFGYQLVEGPETNVRVALIGLIAGSILGIVRLRIQGNTADLRQELVMLPPLAISSSYAWKGMFMASRNIRIGGIIGAIASMLYFFFDPPPIRSDNITMLLRILTMVEFAPYGALLGIGITYKPLYALIVIPSMGILIWIAGDYATSLNGFFRAIFWALAFIGITNAAECIGKNDTIEQKFGL